MAGPNLQITVGANVTAAAAAMQNLGNVSEHAFDEIAAGAAALDRIAAEIDAMAAAAARADASLGLIGQSAVQVITPVAALEARLEELRAAAGRVGTVQGAAQLAVQYDILNRTLTDTRNQINAAATAAIGLSRAFNTIATSSTSLNRLSPAIRPVLTDLRLVPPAANAAAASLARIRPAAAGGGAALTDFSRIVQDAPFGIIGITNNITQAADSFGNLVRASGGVGPAFRSLFSAATGFGGISLAISLITSALTFASVGLGAWTRGFGSNKKAVDDAKKATEEFVSSLKSVESITAQATGSVQGQIATVTALASVLGDTTQAYDRRKRALQELAQINKNYFGDLKLETLQLGVLSAKVKEYTNSIVAQAVLKGFTDEISRVAPELGKQQEALDRARNKYKALDNQLKNTKSEITDLRGNIQTNPVFRDLTNQTEDARKAFVEQRTAVEKLSTNYVLLQGRVAGAVQKTLEFADTSNAATAANKKEEDSLKQRIDALKTLRDEIGLSAVQGRELVQLEVQLLQRDGVKLGFTTAEVQERVENLVRNFRLGEEIKPVAIQVPLIVVPRQSIDVAGETGTEKIAEDYATDLTDKLNKTTNEAFKAELDFGPAIANALSDTLSAVGEGGDVFGTIFQAIGSGLKSLGSALIAYGVAAEAFKKTFNNPFAAIAAGAGLILAGSLLQRAIPKFANGVTGFSGGVAMVGEVGPELVRLPTGSDVIPNSRLGEFGGNGSSIIGETVIRGNDLYTVLRRENARKRRL